MTTPLDPRREHEGTYFVQDRDDKRELERLHIQDQMTTVSMGGVLPEQSDDPSHLQRVLDVGCGTGDWIIEMAKTYPDIPYVMGVDVNRRFLEYAHAQAEAQQVGDRVQFRSMDALLMLEFPNAFFDLVNHRFALSWLRTWDWQKMLGEYQRVCKAGGVIRVTEAGVGGENSSPALTYLLELLVAAFHRSGHFFTPTPDGITSQLARLLQDAGVQEVQTQPNTTQYRAGTVEAEHFIEDMRLAFRTMAPAIRKWGQLPKDYEEIYQQMLKEMAQPDFTATWNLLTAWGINGMRLRKPSSR